MCLREHAPPVKERGYANVKAKDATNVASKTPFRVYTVATKSANARRVAEVVEFKEPFHYLSRLVQTKSGIFLFLY